MHRERIIHLDLLAWRDESEGWIQLRDMFISIPDPPSVTDLEIEFQSDVRLLEGPALPPEEDRIAELPQCEGVVAQERSTTIECLSDSQGAVVESNSQRDSRHAIVETGNGFTTNSLKRIEKIDQKNGRTAALIELAGGVFQIFGLGHFYAGRTAMGVAFMIGYWIALALNLALIVVVVGLFTTPLFWLATMIFSPLRAAAQVQEDRRSVDIQRAGSQMR